MMTSGIECGCRRAAWTLAGLCAVAAGPARAQRGELAPFVGYRFGGSLENTVTGTTFGIHAAIAYGGMLEVAMSGQTRLSVLYTRQETEIDTASAGSVPVTLEYFHVGGTRDMSSRGAARPFVTGALGVGIARAPGTALATRTSFGLGAGIGVKTPSTSRVVLRLEARGFLTFVGDQAAAGTCGGGGCAIVFATGTFLQGEVAAGLGFRF